MSIYATRLSSLVTLKAHELLVVNLHSVKIIQTNVKSSWKPSLWYLLPHMVTQF